MEEKKPIKIAVAPHVDHSILSVVASFLDRKEINYELVSIEEVDRGITITSSLDRLLAEPEMFQLPISSDRPNNRKGRRGYRFK